MQYSIIYQYKVTKVYHYVSLLFLRLMQCSLFQCAINGLAVTTAAYLADKEIRLPEPSIRITVNCKLSLEEIKFAAATLRTACQALL
jgi:hypothetical protein